MRTHPVDVPNNNKTTNNRETVHNVSPRVKGKSRECMRGWTGGQTGERGGIKEGRTARLRKNEEERKENTPNGCERVCVCGWVVGWVRFVWVREGVSQLLLEEIRKHLVQMLSRAPSPDGVVAVGVVHESKLDFLLHQLRDQGGRVQKVNVVVPCERKGGGGGGAKQ